VQKEKDSASSRLAANLNQAVLYVRVFSKAQEVGYSLDAQEKLATNSAKRRISKSSRDGRSQNPRGAALNLT
jgi:hypothetical protein